LESYDKSKSGEDVLGCLVLSKKHKNSTNSVGDLFGYKSIAKRTKEQNGPFESQEMLCFFLCKMTIVVFSVLVHFDLMK